MTDFDEHSDDEHKSAGESGQRSGSQWGNAGAPEPPPRWNAQASEPHRAEEPPFQQQLPQDETRKIAVIGSTRFELKGAEVYEFESARRYVTISQVVAVVSLFFGGILLSIAAMAFALIARNKLNRIAMAHDDDPQIGRAIRRSSLIAVGVVALALVLNIVSTIYLYPYVMDAVQSGNIDSLFGGGAPTSTGSGGSSTWG